LAIDGYQGKEYFWDENDSKHIQYFSHKSVTFPNQEILVSNFRIKSIDTFLLLPTNNDYVNFANRCKKGINCTSVIQSELDRRTRFTIITIYIELRV
jgi:transcription elongation factor